MLLAPHLLCRPKPKPCPPPPLPRLLRWRWLGLSLRRSLRNPAPSRRSSCQPFLRWKRSGCVAPEKVRLSGSTGATPLHAIPSCSRDAGIQDALITRLQIRSHPGLRADQTALLTLLPQPREMQNSVAVSLLPQHNRAFIVLLLPDFLRDRQYSLWVMINRQPLKPCLQPLPNQLPHERAFEVVLVPGMNIIEAHLIAAIPRRERQPSGPEVELEVLAVYAHLART